MSTEQNEITRNIANGSEEELTEDVLDLRNTNRPKERISLNHNFALIVLSSFDGVIDNVRCGKRNLWCFGTVPVIEESFELYSLLVEDEYLGGRKICVNAL